MSIYNRDYMRPTGSAVSRPFNAIKTLLISLVAVFLVQMIFRAWFQSLWFDLHLGLSIGGVFHGFIHTFLTYGFLHDTSRLMPMHLIFNGLLIYFAGRYVQMRIGSERLMEAYLLAVLAGGLFWFLVRLATGSDGLLIGASAGASALLAMFCFLQWRETIRFHINFLIPVSMLGSTLFYISLGFAAFFFLFGEISPASRGSSVAHSAHLGGMGAAYLYFQYLLGKPTLWSRIRSSRTVTQRSPKWKRQEVAKKMVGRTKVNLRKPSPGLKAEVDRILDKINSEGFGSLSEEERATLDRAKDVLK